MKDPKFVHSAFKVCSVAKFERRKHTEAVASLLFQCKSTIYNSSQSHIHATLHTVLIPLLPHHRSESSSERALHLVCAPVNLDLALVHILVDPLHSLPNSSVLPLAFFQHLEHQIATDARVIGVAKVLVDALLERFNAFADFFRIMRVHELLEYRA